VRLPSGCSVAAQLRTRGALPATTEEALGGLETPHRVSKPIGLYSWEVPEPGDG
jgi:hypothetical protein